MNRLRPPDRVLFSKDIYSVTPGTFANETWSHQGTEVGCRIENDFLAVDVRSPGVSVHRVVLRWDQALPAETQFLGDHWERGYGDLAWRGFIPERVMPWYFLGHAKETTAGWGVKTGAIPWELNRQWLSLLAESGTPLFVSAAPGAVGVEQKAELRAAFATASQTLEPAEPLDWMETTCPQRWKIGGKIKTYDWSGTNGGSPCIMA
jgi:hypothetical protein